MEERQEENGLMWDRVISRTWALMSVFILGSFNLLTAIPPPATFLNLWMPSRAGRNRNVGGMQQTGQNIIQETC